MEYQDIQLSEDTIRRNLHLMPRPEKPSRMYRFLHGINVCLRVLIVILLLLLLFRIQRADVVGSKNITDAQIMTWLGEDKKAYNSLYAMYKFNIRKAQLNPSIEETHVSLRLPWRVRIKVKELPAAGMVETEGGHYVFNRLGMLISTQQVDHYGVLITGVTPEETGLYQKLTFKEGDMEDQILALIRALDDNMLEPDQAVWFGDEAGWQLRFGSTWANLGTVITPEKIQQLAALYTEVKDRAGVIHLEYYESGDEIVRFEQGLPAGQ